LSFFKLFSILILYFAIELLLFNLLTDG